MEKSNGTTGTLYWYMSPGIVAESDLSGNLQSEYVFFDGERVARRDFPRGAVSYYFSDHLKTTDIVTDAQGNIKNESDFYPWGGELQLANNDSNHYKFTGKERDNETGLDYFGARYYSNGLGRFITPDWAAKAAAVPYAELADPQSLNLYSYVRNVPTTRFDADGHCDSGFFCDLGKGILVGLARANELSAKANDFVNRAIGFTPSRPGGDSMAAETGKVIEPKIDLSTENKTQEVAARVTAVVVPVFIPGGEEEGVLATANYAQRDFSEAFSC